MSRHSILDYISKMYEKQSPAYKGYKLGFKQKHYTTKSNGKSMYNTLMHNFTRAGPFTGGRSQRTERNLSSRGTSYQFGSKWDLEAWKSVHRNSFANTLRVLGLI